MSASLFRLPASTTLTAEQALHDALGNNLQDVLVIGYDQAGDLVIRSSRMSCAEALFLCSKAARWAESGGQQV